MKKNNTTFQGKTIESKVSNSQKSRNAFTLIELIVVMAVIGILVLLAAPKFIGYTERARETKHIHTAKVIETALEVYLINGGDLSKELEVADVTSLQESAGKESLIGVNGYVFNLEDEVYYELTYDFVKKLDVKLVATNEFVIEALASSVPTAIYTTDKGVTLVDKTKTMKGYQLQDGEIPNEVEVANVAEIKGGYGHTLLKTKDGKVWSWGTNSSGQLGNGTSFTSLTPVLIESLTDVISISVGASHSVALTKTGSVYTWGANMWGQIGNKSNLNALSPIEVLGLGKVVSIAAGNSHVVALNESGELYAWGLNDKGQLGNTTNVNSNVPVEIHIPTTKKIRSVAAGNSHTFAIDEDGSVWAWGDNSFGQLGNGTINNENKPIKLEGISKVSTIVGGVSHSLALTTEDKVFSWGYNAFGQLGDGTIVNKITPVEILSNIELIAVGHNHSLAVNNKGALFVWGSNGNGQLGNNSYAQQNSPIEIGSASNAQAIGAGWNHSLVINKEGAVLSWGENRQGQLGNGNMNGSTTPVSVKNANASDFTVE